MNPNFTKVFHDLIEDIRECEASQVTLSPPSQIVKILIVEDDSADYEWMCHQLMEAARDENVDTQISKAVTATDAVDMLANPVGGEFRVVFLDLKLSFAGDGVQVFKWCRLNKPAIRIVIVSGTLDQFVLSELNKIGGYFEIVTKPMINKDAKMIIKTSTVKPSQD